MGIRRELFKLHYLSEGEGRFNLNTKAEAFEVMDYLLSCMHTWMQVVKGNKPLPAFSRVDLDASTKVAEMFTISFKYENDDSAPCFIH